MTEDQQARRFWTERRRHPAFRAALVFAGGSWLALQAADIFALDTGTVRRLAVIAFLLFLAAIDAKMVALWQDADPELQPIVESARGALAELGTGRRTS